MIFHVTKEYGRFILRIFNVMNFIEIQYTKLSTKNFENF